MTETQKRIQAYKDALPGLKERVAAVALLLVMSFAMMTSASFAWLTISLRPEVTGVNTTVTANGSLEIALVGAEGSRPAESAVGDSTATKGQTVTSANITWGNLVNLSDPTYGLENLTLRPAELNTASLLESPLYGAVYGLDGRITQLSSNFGYATWNMPEGNKPGYFGVSDSYGVRAISSTKVEAVGADAIYFEMVSTAKDQNLAAATMYKELGNNNQYMPSLATMMGLYMTARMNPSHETLSNPDCSIEDIQNLRDMYAAFLDAFDQEAQAMASLVNLQLFLKHGEGNYTPYTADMIYATTTAKLKAEGLQISSLDQFIKDRNVITSDLAKLTDICQSGASLKWKDSGLNAIVNNLVDVGACTIGANNTPISSIGASNATSYLSGTQEARITNGILYRFEERTGGYIEVKNLGISAKVNRMNITIPATVKANIQTTAPRDYNLFTNDLTYTQEQNTGDYAGGIPVAQDTYGLAVDLWVRTNAAGTYLTLEGNVLTETKEVRATGTDPNGNTVELYTVTIAGTDEEGNSFSYSMDLYEDTDGWHNADNHAAVTGEELGEATPMPKMESVVTVLGYEGANRIWDDSKLLSTDATTQGSGSCYIYYADTPEDQARSLKLLEAFNVAFVDEEGKLLGKAIMDTERHYAASGRVIVPLILDPSASINLGTDYTGIETYGLTPLQQNVPTRITAIVYLDGTKLTNQEVLAAADIQGQLNIQFGSSQSLKPIDNETLENAVRSVSASVDKTKFNYDTATEPMTTNVTVRVDGEEPNSVTAFFLRAISSTQGSREEAMTFTKNDSGEWVASHTFTVPGKYVLRTVRLDGVDFDLATVPEVIVEGFTVETLSCDQATDNYVSIMTAANSHKVDLRLKFATDDPDKMPETVAGRFLREDGTAVNITFNYNASGPNQGFWTGSATFLTSGEYTMQYLVLDGKYTELAGPTYDADGNLTSPGLWQTAKVILGMRVAVYTTSPHSFKYVPSEMADNEKLLAMEVKVMDNAGNEMPGMDNVKLTYGMKGSGVKKMDADLAWDGTYYSGELTTTGPGIWQFSQVVVGGNILTNATTSPTFTIMSPEPPEYDGHRTTPYQYVPNNDARMNVIITNSAAASVSAYLVKNGAAEGVWVEGTIGNELETEDGKQANYWNFTVPKDVHGYQDGNWKLTDLKLWDVYAADGSAYTEESPLEISVADTNNVTKVVSQVYVQFAENKSADFGKTDGKVTGVFMDSYTVSGLAVTIRDFEHKPISGISNVKLKYVYGNNSGAYGGYTSDSLTNALADFTVDFTVDPNDATRFVQKEDKTLQYAGSYTPILSYTIGSKIGSTEVTLSGEKLPANASVYTVWSNAPTTKISSAYHTSTSSNAAASHTDTSTTVYILKTSGTCNATNYTPAKVTITLSGLGKASSAKLQFTTTSNGGKVYLYQDGQQNNGTATDAYEWTADGGCLRHVGYWRSKAGGDEKTAAGTLTATKLTITYNSATYTVDIPDITISNPE